MAYQTNILALNESIDDARAGQSDKGSAAVPNEVRSLTEQSGTSVK